MSAPVLLRRAGASWTPVGYAAMRSVTTWLLALVLLALASVVVPSTPVHAADEGAASAGSASATEPGAAAEPGAPAAATENTRTAGEAQGTDAAPPKEATPAPTPEDPGPGTIHVLRLDDVPISVGASTLLIDTLENAKADPSARLLLIELDTPGGSLQETREMVEAMLGSELPIAVYVSPRGGRAASAGVFLTMAAHVAAMAPATNIGAAHPVMLGGGGGDDEGEDKDAAKDSEAAMLEKVTNDTVAWARGIARERDRNGDWAEDAVRNSVSIEAPKAVELDVVDFVAEDRAAVLAQAEGRTVKVASGRVLILRTSGPVIEAPISIRQQALLFVGDPNIAYLLLSLGMLLLWIEFKSGGLWIPGIAGLISLGFAAIGLSILPVNLVAVLLVVLGVGLVIAEVYLPTFGLLTVLGVGSLVGGGLFLIRKTPEFDVGVSTSILVSVAAMAALTSLAVGALVLRGQLRPVRGGREGLVGERGIVKRALPGGDAPGSVFVHGELWSARSSAPVAVGETIIVEQVVGLLLVVKRAPPGPGGA